MKTKFYITTPIYYPSAHLHIGHAYCTTMCDIYKRYRKLRGQDCYFLTGSDEHGMKIQKNAEAAGTTPQAFVDDIVVSFKELWKKLEISNDDYIRTTDERHVEVVKKVFSIFLKNGDIYKSHYEGWYCRHEESFWTDTQVGPEHLCPECGRPVEKAQEEAYFFKTSKYIDRLLKFYEDNPKFLTPISRKNEMINTFIKPGLEDLCITRTSFSWGVKVDEDPKHVVYVWLDALLNYISALGYLSKDDHLFQEYWQDPDCEIIHVLGADITRFHAIYWPMFLMALGIRLPDREFIHGLLMMKDGKMSKSRGNTVDPIPLVDHFGVDTVRYYLVREVPFGNDGQFTPEQFVERVNMDLANSYGNLLNRTIGMIDKYFEGMIPSYKGHLTPFDDDLENVYKSTLANYELNLDDLKITDAFINVMDLINRANKYIDETTPWVLAKEGKVEELASVMNHLANVLYASSILLSPVLVETKQKALDSLSVPEELRSYEAIKEFGKLGNVKVNKLGPLFPRLDNAIEVEFIKNLMGAGKKAE